MFERYTEKARRTIFFARYEASQTGSPVIETEHLLLGLLRENHTLLGDAMAVAKFVGEFRLEITNDLAERVSTSVDLPLSHEAKRVLHYGAEEARQMGHLHIGTEHLFLGLLRVGGSLAARLSREHGIEIEAVRERVSNSQAHFKTGNRPDDIPADRNALHALIDTLPEPALMAAQNMLRRMQTWPQETAERPPQRRMGITGGTHEGSHFSSRSEDGALIRESHVVFHGHEIDLTESFKISEDSKQLKYSQQLRGPKREHQIEIDFDLT